MSGRRAHKTKGQSRTNAENSGDLRLDDVDEVLVKVDLVDVSRVGEALRERLPVVATDTDLMATQ
jgi:hypothetical protein